MREPQRVNYNLVPDNGPVFPACNNSEMPFMHNGVTWLYIYQPSSGCHGYLNCDTDVINWDPDFCPFD